MKAQWLAPARVLGVVLLSAATTMGSPMTAIAAPGERPPLTWYVRADAGGTGNGTIDRPWSSLTEAEHVSAPGDTIVVEPSPLPLDGGIVLKPDQKLVGGGPSVLQEHSPRNRPRITGSGSQPGDTVTLAPRTEVRNLVFDGANRSAIYGLDAVGAVVADNDVFGTNQSCHDGFVIGPFQIPASIAVRKAVPVLPNYVTLNNGWAAMMLDYRDGTGTLTVTGNHVHDTRCGDGIDIRTFGTSKIDATVTANVISDINAGPAKLSVLALGLQSRDASSLTATLSGNAQQDIADPRNDPLNSLADSEGVFLNPLDRSHMDVDVLDNHFVHGEGNFSANGLEYVTTTGSPTSTVTVSNSEFTDVTGDVIESYNLSPDAAHHSLTLDGVQATRSHFPGAALNPSVPANLGSCLVTTGFGRNSTTVLAVRNSTFADCSADGIGVVTYVPEGPEPMNASMSFDIRDSVIDDTAANGINIVNVGSLQRLSGRVEDTTVSDAAHSAVATANYGSIAESELDFGGGTLGSRGGNCFDSERAVSFAPPGIPMSDRNNWWGGFRPDAASNDATDSAQFSPAARPYCA